MIFNNLITAVMVSMAVGGNTATAFNKEPQKATSDSTNIILNGTINYDLQPNNVRITTSYDGWTLGDTYDNEVTTPEAELYWRLWYAYDDTPSGSFSLSLYYGIMLIQIGLYDNYSAGNFQIEQLIKTLNLEYNYAGQIVQSNKINVYNDEAELYTYIFDSSTPQSYAQLTNIGNNIEEITPQYTYNNSNQTNITTGSYTYTLNTPSNISTETQNLYETGPVYVYIRFTANIPTGTPNTRNANLNFKVDSLKANVYWERTAPITQEAVPIIPMLYSIITMPFTFITTAFGFTLWAGTPYAVSLGDIILFIVGMLILVFIANVIIKFWK